MAQVKIGNVPATTGRGEQTPARTINVAERRARLGRRHCLAAEAQLSDPAAVAEAIVAYHATDPASVYLAAAARTGLAAPAALDRALYERRNLLRMLGMRRTMFVVPTAVFPLVQAGCTDAIAVQERRRTLQMIVDSGVTVDAEGWLAAVSEQAVAALRERGEATTSEVAADVPELKVKVTLAPGKPYQATTTLAPRVLLQLGAEAKVVRGRPVRSWVSNYRWSLLEAWLAGGAPWEQTSAPAARQELARRWLAAFGPGTLADLKWWTGWTSAQARHALTALGAVAVELDAGEQGFVLPDDLAAVAAPEPWAALLPGLDPTSMGWAMPGRRWFLSERGAQLYDRNGNLGPTVWWCGRVVGGWAQQPDGSVVYRLFEDVDKPARAAIRRVADQLAGWLGEVRVTPRFRTPLERELAAGAATSQ